MHDQSTDRWDGTVPRPVDLRLLGVVGGLAALAASVNVPFGGLPFAVIAFGVLATGGVLAHIRGRHRLHRITSGLAERWDEDGTGVEAVELAAGRTRTTWVVRTAAGPVTISGLALAPVSKVAIEWRGTTDVLPATDAEDRLDTLATSWFREVTDETATVTG